VGPFGHRTIVLGSTMNEEGRLGGSGGANVR